MSSTLIADPVVIDVGMAAGSYLPSSMVVSAGGDWSARAGEKTESPHWSGISECRCKNDVSTRNTFSWSSPPA
jgi:hypothetical protein